jgi:hypothetical protein
VDPDVKIIEVDDFGVQLEVHLLHELAAGDDVLDAGHLDAGVHHVGGNRVVEVHGNPLVEGEGHVDEKPWRGRRHQHADILLVLRQRIPSEYSAEDERAEQHVAAG